MLRIEFLEGRAPIMASKMLLDLAGLGKETQGRREDAVARRSTTFGASQTKRSPFALSPDSKLTEPSGNVDAIASKRPT
jgi:hypothetical protein